MVLFMYLKASKRHPLGGAVLVLCFFPCLVLWCFQWICSCFFGFRGLNILVLLVRFLDGFLLFHR